ncbi:MAG: Uma2 family endonuclease [Phormidesmis sp.]
MAVTTQKLTFEEYLTYEDGTDTRYELVNGELVPMSLGTGRHGDIIWFLARYFEETIIRIRRPWTVRPGVIGVQSPRGRQWDTSRIPDVTVLPTEQWEAMSDREAVINLNEPPPLLVVEVVSPSTKSDDYRAKRGEYGYLEIPEYWIVDPLAQKVTICILDNQFYDASEFSGEEKVQSPTFSDLALTAAQVLAGKL